MTEDNQRLLSYYWNQFEEEIKKRSELYDKSVRMILTIPLFVNAGAAIALTNFYSNANPDVNIRLATGMFLLGTTLGILTLAFEFFFAYFSQINLHEYLIHFNKIDKTSDTMLTEFKKHFADNFILVKKTQGTILLRIINGSISTFFCFLGIYFITTYLLKNYWASTAILITLIIYFTASFCWMKSKFKSDYKKTNELVE
jgi:hypothetical protein